jgi:[acyl-carrier-protein] S-malonyltransferase
MKAVIFPGQGSQHPGMLADMAKMAVLDTFAEAKAILGLDLWQIAQHGDAQALTATEITQPLLLTANIALWRQWLWESKNQLSDFSAFAGHSLGEYAALVAAEVLTFAEALPLVALRAQLMQNAVPMGEGAMAAVLRLEDAAVQAICQEIMRTSGEVVEAVNFNAPGQVVIAGQAAAVAKASELCKSAGGKVLLLPVSVPAHSSLMRPAAATLAEAIVQTPMQLPKVPVLQNLDAEASVTVEQIRQKLIAQLYSPVLWVNTLTALADTYGVKQVLECGPGTVLTGLLKRQPVLLAGFPLHTAASFSQALSLFAKAA